MDASWWRLAPAIDLGKFSQESSIIRLVSNLLWISGGRAVTKETGSSSKKLLQHSLFWSVAALKKKVRKKRSELVKKSLLRFFFFLIKRPFMFRQHCVMKYKQTYLGIFKPTFKVLWLTKTGALLHFYLKILFWFFFLPPLSLLGWERFLKSYMFSQNKKIIFHSALESVH